MKAPKLTCLMIVCLLWQALPARASTVLPLEFEQVVDTAELVFEGEVLSVESRQTGARRIHTFVRFRVDEVIKGDFSGEVIELRYLGGEVDGRRLQVTDMDWPGVGERGVYFVESLQRPMVHPLVGWSQGRYRIETDDQGTGRVFTAGRRPVTTASSGGGEVLLRPQQSPPRLGQGGSSDGQQVIGLSRPAEAMSITDFRQRIRNLAGSNARPLESDR